MSLVAISHVCTGSVSLYLAETGDFTHCGLNKKEVHVTYVITSFLNNFQNKPDVFRYSVKTDDRRGFCVHYFCPDWNIYLIYWRDCFYILIWMNLQTLVMNFHPLPPQGWCWVKYLNNWAKGWSANGVRTRLSLKAQTMPIVITQWKVLIMTKTNLIPGCKHV